MNNKEKIYILLYRLGLNRDIVDIIYLNKLYLETDEYKGEQYLNELIIEDLKIMNFESLFHRIDTEKNNYLNILGIKELFKLMKKEEYGYVGYTDIDWTATDGGTDREQFVSASSEESDLPLNQIIHTMINETRDIKMTADENISYFTIKEWIKGDIGESYLEMVKGDRCLLFDYFNN
jgi:hypothetical protein